MHAAVIFVTAHGKRSFFVDAERVRKLKIPAVCKRRRRFADADKPASTVDIGTYFFADLRVQPFFSAAERCAAVSAVHDDVVLVQPAAAHIAEIDKFNIDGKPRKRFQKSQIKSRMLIASVL